MEKSEPVYGSAPDPAGAEQVLTYNRRFIQRLLAAAEDDKKDVAILEEMLWLVNVHPKLSGLVQAFRHISEINQVLAECPETDSLRAQVSRWAPLLEWVAEKPAKLAERLFPEAELNFERNRGSFLRSTRPNPLIRNGPGVTRFGLHGALWASHPQPYLQKQFRVLQGRVLDAHLAITRREFGFSEWKEGLRPTNSFEDGQRRSTWAVRRLATDDEFWRNRLGKIKPEHTRSELIEALNEMADSLIFNKASDFDENDSGRRFRRFNALQREADACESALRSIAGFLHWSIHPEERRKRSGGGGGGHGGESSPCVVEGGAGDGDEEDDDTGLTVELPHLREGHSDHRSRVGLPTRWRSQRSEKYRATIKAGDHPGEAFASQPQALSEDAAGAAFARGGGIEMSNQLLPWSFSEMSIAEMGEILVHLNRFAKSGNPEHVEILALVKTVLWTGSSLKRAQSLVIGSEADLTDGTALFVQTNSGTKPLSLAGAEWKLRALELEYKNTDFDPRRARRLAHPHVVTLPVPRSVSTAIEGLLQRDREADGNRNDHAGGCGSDVRRPFEKSSKAYEAILAREFSNATFDVSFGRISKLLFRRIYQQTGGNIVAAALITGTDHYLASVRRHYCTPRIIDLQGIYRQAVTSIAEDLTKYSSSLSAETASIPDLERNVQSVGSPVCPTDKSLARAFSNIERDIRGLRNTPWDPSNGGFRRRHNIYTFYVVLSFSIATAMRGVSTPYLHTSEIDVETGLAVITDKDSGSGYKSRLVWLPDSVREQMRRYEEYLAAISKRLRLRASTKEMPCYFLDESGEAVEVRPKTLFPYLKQYLDLPANAVRHWTCTHLREQVSTSSESVDGLMGHWWRGEEPWGTFSSFSYAEFRSEVAKALEEAFKLVKFRPVSIQKRRGSAH
jgi:hypothetical protein